MNPPLLSFDFGNEIIQHLILTVAVLAVIILLARIVQRLVLRYVDEPGRRYNAGRIIRRSAGLVVLIALILIWSPGERNVVTLFTVIGAGLAIANREVLLSMAGWLTLAIRVPFRQGDRIEINGVKGDVVDIRLLHSTMLEIGGWVDADQSTGRLVHIPNSWLFQHAAYNYTRGFNFIWNEIPVTVTFRSDWAAARDIMLNLAQESTSIIEQQAAQEIRAMSREYYVHFSILTPFVYVSVQENGIRLTLRYLCEARKRRGTQHALTISLLEAFQAHGSIELAYPMFGITSFDTPQFGPLPTTQPK
jgi:small-conductance mechanosensitive channel